MAGGYATSLLSPLGDNDLVWLARKAEPSSARTAILAGGVAVTVLMAALSLYGALAGIVGPMIWSAVVIEVALAAAFIYYYVKAH